MGLGMIEYYIIHCLEMKYESYLSFNFPQTGSFLAMSAWWMDFGLFAVVKVGKEINWFSYSQLIKLIYG